MTDILVIGGGPAGTAAAIWAAQCGLRVTLLERTKFPRHRPGETLHPGVETILDQLGVAKQVAAQTEVRHEGHRICWAGRRSLVRFGSDRQGPWRGYQILRERLDNILMIRAKEVGVIVFQPQAASTLLFSGKRVIGLSFPNTVRAYFVIDASGPRGFLRRALQLSQVIVSPPLRAYYGYGTADSDSGDAIPSLVGDERGWVWTAKIGPRKFTWTQLAFDAGSRPANLGFQVPGVQWQTPVKGADVTWRVVPESAGPGYFIVGDAAAVVDPASSHGVLRAMMSGMMAANIIARVAFGLVTESNGLAEYRAWHRAWFEHETQRLRELYCSLGAGRLGQ